MTEHTGSLLQAEEPPAWRTPQQSGHSAFLLICDHAGSRIPRVLGTLGLPVAERHRHIAWDIGAAGLTTLLAARLDAWAILQTYSRLVIDCNRAPGSPTSIVALSERTKIPGNEALSDVDARRRAQEIFWPYHERIGQELDLRARQSRSPILVSVHSFTPTYLEIVRPWHVGVLYREPRFARLVMQGLRSESGIVVGDNEPYALSDSSDYSVPMHAERRGIAHVEIEVRQDLIADESGQVAWADRLEGVLRSAEKSLNRQ
ncbi:MAG TPA: N-formylglutamate amidohydrolase [Steroidobacteraceae bacterium]